MGKVNGVGCFRQSATNCSPRPHGPLPSFADTVDRSRLPALPARPVCPPCLPVCLPARSPAGLAYAPLHFVKSNEPKPRRGTGMAPRWPDQARRCTPPRALPRPATRRHYWTTMMTPSRHLVVEAIKHLGHAVAPRRAPRSRTCRSSKSCISAACRPEPEFRIVLQAALQCTRMRGGCGHESGPLCALPGAGPPPTPFCWPGCLCLRTGPAGDVRGSPVCGAGRARCPAEDESSG